MESGGGREGIRPLTAEEEALKRNTDCVYFLASPLTCKKGNECEYRHSEGARINPRDCWYWMNGNCLNPKCSFRHPPLDGLFGTSGPSSGPAKPPLQTATTVQMPTAHAPYTMNKQSVPCYYFQKGHCLKGEKCPFMHAPQTSGNPVSQQVAKVSTTTELPQANKKDSGVITDCTMQQSIPSQQNVPAQQSVPQVSFDKPKGSVNKPVQVPLASVKPVTKAESAPNNVPVIKKSLPPYSVDDVLSGIQQNRFPVSSGYAVNRLRDHQVQPSDERPQNGREVDEFLGESSPGFDVLVDDDIEEPDYFHDEDNFGRASVQSGRNLNPIDEYEYHHNDYEMDTNFERDRYNGLGEYDQYGQVHDAYGREPCRASERILERPLPERRISRREANYDERDGSDLRHRLLKRRRLNGSRSAVSPDGRSEPYQRDDHSIEERDRGHHSRRNQRRIPRESSISARLRGRITLPGRSSPDVSTELQSENDRNRGRPRGRLSPPRPMNHQGRHHHERVRRRSNEEFAADARSTGGKPTRRDDTDFLDFAGPKSLAELKVAKAMENSQGLSAKNTSATVPPELNNMKSAKVVRDSEDSLSFEGPKPLSVILKRKREAASGNGAISSSGDENNHRDGEVAEGGSASAALSDVQSAAPVEAKKDVSDSVSRLEERKDETAEEEEEGLIIHGEEEGSIYDGRSSIKEDMLETDYRVEVDAMDDEDLENYDQRYGESDYEAGEGGDLKTEDDENVYQEDEDEMDDEDDFAKKVGVMFS